MPRKPRFGRIYHPKKKRPDGTRTEIRTWWVAYYVNGSQTRESSKSQKYKDAENLLRRRIAELETGVYAGPAAERVKVTELLDELIEDFENNDKSVTWVRYVVGHLRPFFGHMRAARVQT